MNLERLDYSKHLNNQDLITAEVNKNSEPDQTNNNYTGETTTAAIDKKVTIGNSVGLKSEEFPLNCKLEDLKTEDTEYEDSYYDENNIIDCGMILKDEIIG